MRERRRQIADERDEPAPPQAPIGCAPNSSRAPRPQAAAGTPTAAPRRTSPGTPTRPRAARPPGGRPRRIGRGGEIPERTRSRWDPRLKTPSGSPAPGSCASRRRGGRRASSGRRPRAARGRTEEGEGRVRVRLGLPTRLRLVRFVRDGFALHTVRPGNDAYATRRRRGTRAAGPTRRPRRFRRRTRRLAAGDEIFVVFLRRRRPTVRPGPAPASEAHASLALDATRGSAPKARPFVSETVPASNETSPKNAADGRTFNPSESPPGGDTCRYSSSLGFLCQRCSNRSLFTRRAPPRVIRDRGLRGRPRPPPSASPSCVRTTGTSPAGVRRSASGSTPRSRRRRAARPSSWRRSAPARRRGAGVDRIGVRERHRLARRRVSAAVRATASPSFQYRNAIALERAGPRRPRRRGRRRAAPAHPGGGATGGRGGAGDGRASGAALVVHAAERVRAAAGESEGDGGV